jgi:hypothetical protein
MDERNKTIRIVVITLCLTVIVLCAFCSCTALGTTLFGSLNPSG